MQLKIVFFSCIQKSFRTPNRIIALKWPMYIPRCIVIKQNNKNCIFVLWSFASDHKAAIYNCIKSKSDSTSRSILNRYIKKSYFWKSWNSYPLWVKMNKFTFSRSFDHTMDIFNSIENLISPVRVSPKRILSYFIKC